MTYMLKMLKYGLYLSMVSMLLVLSAQQATLADSPPPADDFGRFLGRTVQCGCMSASDDSALRIYRAYLAEAYGQTYADQAWGHMKLALREAYDNQTIICGYVCGRDSIASLQELLDMGADMYGESVPETDGNAEDDGNYKNWQHCYWRPNSPICADVDDPSSPVIARQDEAGLPECSATEDLSSGVGCQGRQKGRVSGY